MKISCKRNDSIYPDRLTVRQSGVFQGLSQVVHGSKSVKEAKKNLSAHAMMTL